MISLKRRFCYPSVSGVSTMSKSLAAFGPWPILGSMLLAVGVGLPLGPRLITATDDSSSA